MNTNLCTTAILVGEYIVLAALLWGAALLDNLFIHHGGSPLSFASLAGAIALAAWLRRRQLPGRRGQICFYISIPFLIYVWMLGFVSAGAGF